MTAQDVGWVDTAPQTGATSAALDHVLTRRGRLEDALIADRAVDPGEQGARQECAAR
jgi:hypothetical protein